jgi:glycosyltransferase involved in cell wall biosynthesis
VLGFISRLGADRLIATDINRYERLGSFKEKCIVVENYPEDPGEDLASTPLDGPIRIYAGGSMSIRRGLERLIDVVETTPNVEIISAGWLYDNYATNVFAKHPKVSFHGIVKANESLRLAAKCDAIFAFYEPNSVNNRQASPNKVYVAMSIGRPIIINQEASVSKWIVENNLGFRLPYNDTEGLRRLIEKMEERRRFLPKFVQANRQLFNEGYCWEKVEPRLYELYRSVL